MPIKRYFVLGNFLLLPTTLFAQVITDGTLGPKTPLEGPNYQIEANLGQQAGNNLFHSFQEFNLEMGESATFSGPDTLQNVISRVTGGNPSYIDGTIRSSIPNADFYFINPYGMMFGPNATLDVQGSFHASTADYLSLGNDGYFDARNPESSLLTVAPVEAFGFLTEQPGAIILEDSFLQVAKNEALSLVGGEITSLDGTLFAESGRINLAAMAAPGEVSLTPSGLLTTPVESLGTISLSQYSWDNFNLDNFKTRIVEGEPEPVEIANVDVSGQGGGKIFIQAGELSLDNAWIFADIDEGGEQASFINIATNGNLLLTKEAKITADNYGNGPGGNITINTGGIIKLDSMIEEFKLDEDFEMGEDVEFDENLGEPDEYLGEPDEYLGEPDEYLGEPDEYLLSTIATDNFGSGTGGNIYLNTPKLELKSGLVYANTDEGAGSAGDIQIQAQEIWLNDGRITVATNSDAPAGQITIDATNSIFLLNFSQIASSSEESGQGGNIKITTPYLELEQSLIVSGSYGDDDAGNAGSIDITTDTAYLINESGITTEAEHARGGHVNLTIDNELHVLNSVITAQARGSDTQDSGGNITIVQPGLFTLKDSRLLADAYGGNGGNIEIKTGEFIEENSKIDVSSTLGLNGNFYFNEIRLSDEFLARNQGLSDRNQRLESNRCLTLSELSKFLVISRDALPHSPGDLNSYVPFLDDLDE